MNELLLKMIECKKMMLDIAVEMEYYGGLDEEIFYHAKQLAGASEIMGNLVENMAGKYVE